MVIELDGLERRIKEVKRHLLEAKLLRDQAATWLQKAWEEAPEDRRRDIEEARHSLANCAVDLLHMDRFLKEIIK